MKSKILTSIVFLLLTKNVFSQGGTASNARPILGALPLGWTSGSPGPLNIRNDFGTPNAHINFHSGGAPTNFNQRMVINPNKTQVTTVAVQTFLGGGLQNTSGYVGIGLNPAVQAPWSRLHIGVPAGPAMTQAYGGYRDWMGEGLTIQRRDDQLWLGHLQWGGFVDQQNAVINWGDDQVTPGFSSPDHLIFNYTESTYGGPYAPCKSSA
ncbi:MAG: hypothetical protein IPM51_00480 [Sphingobacteriaceae bacterium]|nr:hypothetical protein [Sphingobacteriaceae bacterium]